MMEIKYPFTAPALRVDQRLGSFFVTVLPAELLLQVCASDRMSAKMNPDGSGYTLEGTQRVINDKRLKEIAAYINRMDASFPNSVIVAANYDLETGFDQNELEEIEFEVSGNFVQDSRAWTVEEKADGCHFLTIPSEAKLAAVIDGQHRLFSFANANQEALDSMNLVCSVFLDLPKALQAQIFATINSTQRKVDRSLTYELFGYNVSDEAEEYWTPDKLAVFFARKLGTDSESPLRGRVMVAPKKDQALKAIASEANWKVSTAVVVDGILRLFSSNPKRDANSMREGKAHTRQILRAGARDSSPLRDVFIDGNDALIFQMVLNYLEAADAVFWKNAKPESFIFRTIGVQAIFDILRKIAKDSYEAKDISREYFEKILAPASKIDFADAKFQNPSGSGRTFVRKAIEHESGIK